MKCNQCDNQFNQKRKNNFWCSIPCRDIWNNIKKSKEKYIGMNERVDYVICAICGFHAAALSGHLISHNMTTDEYRTNYNKPTACEIYKEKMSSLVCGEKNPGYNHNGKLSPFSKKFKYHEEEKRNSVIMKAKKTRKSNPQNDTTKIEYYLDKNYSYENAEKELAKRQRTFSLDICIEKFGEKEGHKRWLARQEKWNTNFKKTNFSKISQKLFWEISEKLPSLENIYFAELDDNKEKDITGKNHEYRIVFEKLILPDFLDNSQKKIIEFDGVYWHGVTGRGNKTREEIRENILEKGGYKILHINENDYKKQPEEIIEKCLNFLTK